MYNMKPKKLSFSEDEIFSLFGNEDAEDEFNHNRFEEYFIKNHAFDRLSAQNQHIQLLVGYKGIGKSAMCLRLHQELKNKNEICIKITPLSDLKPPITAECRAGMIQDWIYKLKKCIAEKITGNYKDLIKIATKIVESKVVDIQEETINQILNSIRHKSVNIFVDDIDEGSTGDKEFGYNTSAMMSAIRTISREYGNFKFKVCLRTDAYYQYNVNKLRKKPIE